MNSIIKNYPELDKIMDKFMENNFQKQLEDIQKQLKTVSDPLKLKEKELQNIKKNPYLNLKQKHFKSYLNKCERFSKEKTKKKSLYSTCTKDITEMIKNVVKELDDYKKELLEEYEGSYEELKEAKDDSSQNKLSIYYQLLEKCKKKIKDAKEIIGVQPLLETIEGVKEEIDALQGELKTLKSTKPLNKGMIDRIQKQISDKKEVIKNTEEEIKRFKKDEKDRLKEEKMQEKEQEKEDKERMKSLDDIDDFIQAGFNIDNERIKTILDEFDKIVKRKIAELE